MLTRRGLFGVMAALASARPEILPEPLIRTLDGRISTPWIEHYAEKGYTPEENEYMLRLQASMKREGEILSELSEALHLKSEVVRTEAESFKFLVLQCDRCGAESYRHNNPPIDLSQLVSGSFNSTDGP